MNTVDTTPNSQPQLLVSVRNVAEAHAAVAGGCDILDIKEPVNGSLGMAKVETMTEIVAAMTHSLPTSAALGETTDWIDRDVVPRLPTGLGYVKLGTANLSEHASGLSEWSMVRERFDTANEGSLNWIAVAYADGQRAVAPTPQTILFAAIETGCRGMLIDTFVKDGRSLLSWLSTDELSELSAAVHAAGLIFAVAGSLAVGEISEVVRCRPDIIAVRSAACDGGKRDGTVTARATQALRQALANSAPENVA